MCPWDAEIGEGPHTGKTGHFNAGSEWQDTFTISASRATTSSISPSGSTISASSAATSPTAPGWRSKPGKKALLGPDRTDGSKLEWGNLEAAETLLERCARREDWLGNILADGPKELAEALGGEAKNWVVHTKGGTPAQHEWRPMLSHMLRELVASGGMKPQGSRRREPPADLLYREKWGPLDGSQAGRLGQVAHAHASSSARLAA